ncbi:MAG TPA: M2 family metallopeptidase [Candidatus Acidoferrales bacterium]|nr:M2 family metallopeptidase [Candidatus Acidoferrales bacterium]
MRPSRITAGITLFVAAALCGVSLAAGPGSPAPHDSSALTAEDARKFLDEAQKRLLPLLIAGSRANWVQETYITDDTERLAADANRDSTAATVDLALESQKFRGLALPPDTARQLELLRLSIDFPSPRDPKLTQELADIAASLQSDYGKGRWCPQGSQAKCLQLPDLEHILGESRDPKALADAWAGWHAIARPMRQRFARQVEIANQGARDLGYRDLGAYWRAKYDMPPDEFAREMDRLWSQVRPLYDSLHAYVRARLAQKYGPGVVPAHDPIPADLLGNMWAQSWANIYPLVAPEESDPGFDLTKILKDRNTDARGMVRYGEHFFMSLGFASLPQTFWERSLFTKPADRDVVCHASAWSIDFREDLRIKMCIEINAEDFRTIHHELGHNFYQRAYNQLPLLYQDSANDGFHEAIGDTIALSVTPEYLKKIGLLDAVPPESADIGLLLRQALDKVAFLPFGLLVDQWRWKVFSGEVPPANYNSAWWELRRKYQGVVAPLPRSEEDFDPGAKYHVAADVPYSRYFLAAVLQFQFHRALCRESGSTAPLNRCSIYGSKAAGAKLERMLAMGRSKPWQEALFAMTGEKQMDATAIIDYFAPLKKWLDDQNRKLGATPGW